MNALTSWDFQGHKVRSVEQSDGQPWFVGKDICRALELQNTAQALKRLDIDEKGICSSDTLRGPQQTLIVNEPGVFRLIFTSRAPKAEEFKRWLAHDVLPTLRRDGTYSMSATNPADTNPAPSVVDERILTQAEILKLKIALVRECRTIWNKPAAQRLWKQLGLPDVDAPEATKPAQRGLPLVNPSGALEHLLSWETGNGTVRALVNVSNTKTAASYLANIGLRVMTGRWSGWLAVTGTKGLIDAFRDTAWDHKEWRRSLAALPGAQIPVMKLRVGDAVMSPVMLPERLWRSVQ